ncbi:MAG: hypothetical protein IPM94_16070 [bacterium]|nr:hypothetical protein [bacterium]
MSWLSWINRSKNTSPAKHQEQTPARLNGANNETCSHIEDAVDAEEHGHKLDLEEGYVLKALDHYAGGSYIDALRFYDLALNVNPDEVHIILLKSKRCRLGRNTESVGAHERAKVLDPTIQMPDWLKPRFLTPG